MLTEQAAAVYDLIYAKKDYPAEAACLRALIHQHRRSVGNALLDVACGTGRHLAELRQDYSVEGLDLDPDLLAIARARLPGVLLHEADMLTFDLGRRFDSITCLFGAIAYVRTSERLLQAIQRMRAHLLPGGVLIVEPFLTRDMFAPNTVHATFVDEPDLKLARISRSVVEDGVAIMDMHHLLATPEGVTQFVQSLALGLFTDEQYADALRAAGLDVTHDPVGLIGRGLYIGASPRN